MTADQALDMVAAAAPVNLRASSTKSTTQYLGFCLTRFNSFGPDCEGAESGLVPSKVLERNTHGPLVPTNHLADIGQTGVSFSTHPEHKSGFLT